ncbi:hypothetical protein JB92DRAFT_3066470 [Gautieria morchelliformis]|nr:hypothetical protein JB92DRAFT_3066470 [Gautieria morchelliformis]
MPSYRRLQQYAIAISVISVVYNAAEGGVSIGLGVDSASRSLIFFGIQSAIEVASAIMVLWRFRKVAKPGEEGNVVLHPSELRMEKNISGSIGALLLVLALGTEVSAITALALHQEPDVSNASIIVSASALLIMILIWLPKRYLARALNSSAMQGEATCSLSCIQITLVLFVGSLVFRLWRGGWWVDSATSLLLGVLFGWEGWKMVRWVRSPEFDGGCCGDCGPKKKAAAALPAGTAELGEQYQDLCACCVNKSECKESGECKCGGDTAADEVSVRSGCCKPTTADGAKCCSHAIMQGPRPNAHADPCCDGDQVTACCKSPACDGVTTPDPCNGGNGATAGGLCAGQVVDEGGCASDGCCGKNKTAPKESSSCRN